MLRNSKSPSLKSVHKIAVGFTNEQLDEPKLMGLDQNMIASMKGITPIKGSDEKSLNLKGSVNAKPPERVSMLQRAMADPKKIFPNKAGT